MFPTNDRDDRKLEIVIKVIKKWFWIRYKKKLEVLLQLSFL